MPSKEKTESLLCIFNFGPFYAKIIRNINLKKQTNMAGEFFQAERGQISGIEAQATKEKKTDIASDIQKQKDLFQGEVSKAGKMLADADSKVTLKESKDKVSAYKADITDTLTQIVDSGRRALQAKNPEGDLAVMEMLAGSLKAETGKVKQYVPLFNDVEADKAFIPKIEEKLKKVREVKKAKGVSSQEFNKVFMDAEDLMGKAQEGEVYKWIPGALPTDMQAILNAVLLPLKEQESEIAGYRLERTEDSALAENDEEKELPTDDDKTKEWKEGMREGKSILRKLKPTRAAFEAVQPQMKKISDALKDAKGDPSKAAGISDDADNAMTDLGKVLKDLKTINREKIFEPEYQTLYDNLLGKTQLQLRELADIKLSLKTSEFLKNGLTEEEKKYVTVDDKGNIVKTAEFNKLPKDKQMAFEAKFKLIEIQVSMELDDKTCPEKEKKMLEGRKKMMKGDIFGGKNDLILYYNSASQDPERDPTRFEQCKEMLKQIALMELAQMVQRLAQMKEAVKERYNNNVMGKTDFGTWTYDQAYDNINNMALVLAEAQRMIESGECVTIEGAEKKLRKLDPDSIRVYDSKDSLNQKKEDINKKDDAALQKDKDDLIQRSKSVLKSHQGELDSLITGNINSFAVRGAIQDHGGVTPEDIEKQRDRVKKAEDAVAATEKMSLDDVRNGQLRGVEESLRKLSLQGALKQWQLGFPVDMKSNSWEVFDMFVQQKKLNDHDPKLRKEHVLEEARKARQRGFTALARSMYEDYFADELKIGAKDVDKEKVRKDTLEDKDNIKKLNKSLDTWKENFEKQNGRKPSDEEVADARGKMENMVVGEAYNKAVKLNTYQFMKDQIGPEGNEWREVYGGTVAIEDFKQGGAFTAFWTDEQWNALPVKVGVMVSVTIASGGIASGVVGAAGLAARTGLVAVLGEGTVAGFFGVVSETGATVGGTLAGRGLVFAGESLVEGAAFGAAQYELNGLIMGYDYPRFSTEYWTGIGHSVVTMGVLKGVGTGVGKLKNLSEGANAAKYLTEGGLVTEGAAVSGSALKLYGGGGLVEGFAKDGAWWFGKTSAEGGALVGLDIGSSFLAGRHFTLKEGISSFGSNFVYSGLIGGVHEFMGSGHEASSGEKEKPKIKEEVETASAIGKATKAKLEVDAAKAKLEKAKQEGKPTEKLEADLKQKEFKAQSAEFDMLKAEKDELDAKQRNAEKKVADIQKEIDKQKKKGKVDPKLEAQLEFAKIEAEIAKKAAEPKPIDFGNVESMFTQVDKPFEIPNSFTEKVISGEKFNAEDIGIIEKGIVAGKIDAKVVVEWIHAGRLEATASTIDAMMHQNPYEALVLANEKGISIDAKTKTQIFEALLAEDKNYLQAKDLVDRGIIDVDNPATIDLILKNKNGKTLCLFLVMNGRILLTEKIATELIKDKHMANVLEHMFVADSSNDIFIDAAYSKEKLKEAIEAEHQMEFDSELIYSKAFDLGNNFGPVIQESANRVESGNANPKSKLDAALTRLKERDPTGYNILKQNAATLDTNYIQAIVQGNKTEFTNTQGQKIVAYEGAFIAAGGMGKVSHVAYVVEGSSMGLQYAVIKRPHEGKEEFFEKDKESAQLVKDWNSEYLNSALEIGPDVIIYETGKNAGDMAKKMPGLSSYDAVKVMIDALKGVKVYQDHGKMHADLKEWNILVFDGPNGPQGQLIDNSPTDANKIFNGESPFTPHYISVATQAAIKYGSPESFVAWDNYSMGIVMKQMLIDGLQMDGVTGIPGKGLTQLRPLVEKMTTAPYNTDPQLMGQAIAELEGLLPSLSKKKPNMTIANLPTIYNTGSDVDSKAVTPAKPPSIQ